MIFESRSLCVTWWDFSSYYSTIINVSITFMVVFSEIGSVPQNRLILFWQLSRTMITSPFNINIKRAFQFAGSCDKNAFINCTIQDHETAFQQTWTLNPFSSLFVSLRLTILIIRNGWECKSFLFTRRKMLFDSSAFILLGLIASRDAEHLSQESKWIIFQFSAR